MLIDELLMRAQVPREYAGHDRTYETDPGSYMTNRVEELHEVCHWMDLHDRVTGVPREGYDISAEVTGFLGNVSATTDPKARRVLWYREVRALVLSREVSKQFEVPDWWEDELRQFEELTWGAFVRDMEDGDALDDYSEAGLIVAMHNQKWRQRTRRIWAGVVKWLKAAERTPA